MGWIQKRDERIGQGKSEALRPQQRQTSQAKHKAEEGNQSHLK